jgi:hypothetical protein
LCYEPGTPGWCIGLVSYAGQVWFGAGTDQGLVPDPEELIAAYRAEFETLQYSAQELASERNKAELGEGFIETMNALLDEAIAKVDELLEDR